MHVQSICTHGFSVSHTTSPSRQILFGVEERGQLLICIHRTTSPGTSTANASAAGVPRAGLWDGGWPGVGVAREFGSLEDRVRMGVAGVVGRRDTGTGWALGAGEGAGKEWRGGHLGERGKGVRGKGPDRSLFLFSFCLLFWDSWFVENWEKGRN